MKSAAAESSTMEAATAEATAMEAAAMEAAAEAATGICRGRRKGTERGHSGEGNHRFTKHTTSLHNVRGQTLQTADRCTLARGTGIKLARQSAELRQAVSAICFKEP